MAFKGQGEPSKSSVKLRTALLLNDRIIPSCPKIEKESALHLLTYISQYLFTKTCLDHEEGPIGP